MASGLLLKFIFFEALLHFIHVQVKERDSSCVPVGQVQCSETWSISRLNVNVVLDNVCLFLS